MCCNQLIDRGSGAPKLRKCDEVQERGRMWDGWKHKSKRSLREDGVCGVGNMIDVTLVTVYNAEMELLHDGKNIYCSVNQTQQYLSFPFFSVL